MRRQLVVVGQTVLVGSLQLLGQLGVPAGGRLYARALLGIGVPTLPVVPSLYVPRLPREGARRERHLQVLAIGGQHTARVLREGHRIDDGNILPRVRRITEEPVQVLVAGLLQRKIWPHLVQRHQYVLWVSHDKRVGEPRGELGTQYLLRLVGHVLEEDALLPRPEDVLKHPLERCGNGAGYGPQRNGFAVVCHTRLSLVLYPGVRPTPASATGTLPGRNTIRAYPPDRLSILPTHFIGIRRL